MNRINYNMKEHGFVGHLSIPEQSTKYGVIVMFLLKELLAAELKRSMEELFHRGRS